MKVVKPRRPAPRDLAAEIDELRARIDWLQRQADQAKQDARSRVTK